MIFICVFEGEDTIIWSTPIKRVLITFWNRKSNIPDVWGNIRSRFLEWVGQIPYVIVDHMKYGRFLEILYVIRKVMKLILDYIVMKYGSFWEIFHMLWCQNEIRLLLPICLMSFYWIISKILFKPCQRVIAF